MSSNIVVVRLVSRTYDGVVDYVIRRLEIRPAIYDHQGTKFSRVFIICEQK